MRHVRHRSEDEFEEWVERITERADPFMAWLGILFALLVGYELAVDLTPRAGRVLEIAGWAIWTAFALEFLAKLLLAPRWTVFMRRHWFQGLALLLPTLRVLRFVRLLRLGRAFPAARVVSSSYRAAGTARRLFRSRLAYLGALVVVGAVGVAELAFVFERGEDDAAFASFGDALLWSFATVLGQQADPVPATAGGRIAMILGFATGAVLIGALAGTVGAFLVDARRERAAREPDDAHAAV